MRLTTPVPEPLSGRPFLRAEAETLGVSRRKLQGPAYVRLTHDIYAARELADDILVRADALRLVCPTAAVSHNSAAKAYGLPMSASVGGHVTVPRGALRSIVPVDHVHESRRPEAIQLGGRLITPPSRTFTDLATTLDLIRLVICGDAMVKRGLASPDALIEAARVCPRRGAQRARWASDLVRPRVDAATETRLRLLLVFAGLPEPATGLDVYDAYGAWIARPDLSYPELRIAIEYDGRHHADSTAQWSRDIGRREHFDRAGWRVIVVTAKHLYRQPGPTIMRVLDALHERHHPQAPAMPARLWESWF